MYTFFRVMTCIVWALSLMTGGVAQAAEVIHSFDSDVVIYENGTLRVTETIVVTSTGDKIRQGIYRDFPLRYSGTGQHKGPVPFRVVSVARDGKSLSSSDTSLEGGNIRIFMREKGVDLPHGKHTFVLTYETALHVRYYQDHDELNWNVTGAGWAFLMEQARCTITAPGSIDKTGGWLGTSGSKDTLVTIQRVHENSVQFTSLRDIPQGMQMTVAVSFAKNLVAPEPPYMPTDFEQFSDKLKQYGAPFVNTLWYQGLLYALGALYFLGFWYTRGRDPKKGTVIPLFHPPTLPGEDTPLSPAAMLYIRDHKKSRPEGFAGLLLLLAQRGRIRIIEGKSKEFTLQLANKKQKNIPLPPDARAAYKEIKEGLDAQEIYINSHPTVTKAAKAAQKSLKEHYATTWHSNTWIIAIGWLVVVPLLLFASVLDERFWDEFGSLLFIAVLGVVAFKLRFAWVYNYLRMLLRVGGVWNIIFCIVMVPMCVILCLVFLIIVIVFMSPLMELLDPALATILLGLAIFATIQMKAPTKEGRKLMDAIEGFTLYLKVAEKDRLAQLTKDSAPSDTPERFFDILPYAVALGQTKNWCARYADQIAAGLIVHDAIMVHTWHTYTNVTTFTNALTVGAAAGSGSAFGSGGGGGAGGGSGGGGGGGC